MDNSFEPINLNNISQYYELWNVTPRHSLDYTLINLWGWQEYYGLEWQFSDDLCWVRQTRPHIIWWAPIGPWAEVDWGKILDNGWLDKEKNFIRVPKELLEIWDNSLGEKIKVEDERGQWEYLYLQKNLAELPGNKYHKKRNHYNSYIKTYGPADYKIIDEGLIKDVLAVQTDWCQWHECKDSPSLMAENEAVKRVLEKWEIFRNIIGGSLFVDGQMIAFSVGEILDSETLGVHFEKGLNGYKGVYQTMNCEFAKNAGKGVIWINRAQDLDEEGLRQAKLTYLPSEYLKKYKVKLEK